MASRNKSKVIRILSVKERSLFNAINSEDVAAVRQLLGDGGGGVDVNAQDVFRRTPLIRACLLGGQEGRLALVASLLERGADANSRDNHGRTALMVLCRESPEALPALGAVLRRGADPNARDDEGRTALLHAVGTDNADAVRALIRGAAAVDVEASSPEGDSPLLLAAKQQNAEICGILVSEGRADSSAVPLFLRKYLPPECQGTELTKGRHERFEEYRRNAQDLPGSPYGSRDIGGADPPNRQGPGGEKWRRAVRTVQTASAFEQALKTAQDKKAAAQAKARVEAEAKAEAEARAKAKAEAEAKAEAKAKAKAETEAKAEAKAKAKAETEAKAEAEARAKAETEAKAEAKTKAKAEAEAKAEAKAKAKAEAQAKAEAEARANAETEAKAEAKAKAKTEAEARAKAEAEADAKVAREKAAANARAREEAEARAAAQAREEARRQAEERARQASARRREEERERQESARRRAEEAQAKEAEARAAEEARGASESPRAASQTDKDQDQQPSGPGKKSRWAAIPRQGLSELQPGTPARRNKSQRSKEDLQTYKTKSGRVIYPNAPHDRDYDSIAAVRDGKQPAPRRRGKGKKGPLLPAIAEAAVRKRAVISTT